MPGIGASQAISAARIRGVIRTPDGAPVLSTETASGDPNEMGFGPAVRRYLQTGLYNSDFALVPPISPNLTPTNLPPHWASYVQQSGTAITARIVDNALNASGHALRFTVVPGAALDYTYIEQVVPINGSSNRAFSYRPLAAVNALQAWPLADLEFVTSVQFLRADLSPTGALITQAVGSGDEVVWGATAVVEVGLRLNDIMPPADAYFARVRYGVRRNGANAAAGDIDVLETYLAIGIPHVDLPDVLSPATFGPGRIDQQNGLIRIGSDFKEYPAWTPATAPAVWLQRRLMLGDPGGPTQALVAGTTIQPTNSLVYISSAGNITLTAAPTIANVSGETLLMIINLGAFNITFQDRGTLANSELYLSSATFVMGPNDNLTLLRSNVGPAGWIELGRTNVL